MMTGKMFKILVFIIVVSLYCTVLSAISTGAQKTVLYSLPPEVLRIVSLEFKGIASDIYFLNSLTFLGESSEKQKWLAGSQEKALDWVYQSLLNSTELDGYFMDPYYLMNSAFMWDRYRVKEVNIIIMKGADRRDWDWMLPFYAGFNAFYFMDDYDNSFKYLKFASERQGGNTMLDSLASRIAMRINKTALAVEFLENQIYRSNEPEDSKKSLKIRLLALKQILFLENAVSVYKEKYKKAPDNLEVLVSSGVIVNIPVDPYGGVFFIDDKGAVVTSSNLVSVKKMIY